MRYAGERAYDPRRDGPTIGIRIFLGVLIAIIIGGACIAFGLAAQLW